jgi:hypothetical protein
MNFRESLLKTLEDNKHKLNESILKLNKEMQSIQNKRSILVNKNYAEQNRRRLLAINFEMAKLAGQREAIIEIIKFAKTWKGSGVVSDEKCIWIDYVDGCDKTGDGTFEKPFKSDEAARLECSNRDGNVIFNTKR